MKKFICELCGNEALSKENGVFICMGCGCKYSLTEAQRALHNTASAFGDTEKEHTSDQVPKPLANARGAVERGDYATAARYYETIVHCTPNHSEAIFYIAYAKLESSLVSNDTPIRRAALFSILQGCLHTFAADFDLQHEKEQRSLAEKISADLVKLSRIEFVFQIIHTSIELANEDLTNENETKKLFPALHLEMLRALLQIAKKYESADRQGDAIYLFELALFHADFVQCKYRACGLRHLFDPVVNEVHTAWHHADASHSIPSESTAEGCYIATCVYGSYDCPAVWTLRRYRDNTLGTTWYGRAFIRLYYAVSPSLVRMFGKTRWFQRVWRRRLDHMVKRLNRKGVKNTPYADKWW